jgi:hypothetical protein
MTVLREINGVKWALPSSSANQSLGKYWILLAYRQLRYLVVLRQKQASCLAAGIVRCSSYKWFVCRLRLETRGSDPVFITCDWVWSHNVRRREITRLYRFASSIRRLYQWQIWYFLGAPRSGNKRKREITKPYRFASSIRRLYQWQIWYILGALRSGNKRIDWQK